MRRTIAVFLLAVAFLAAEFFTNGQQAFAGTCKKYEYTAPKGVSILTEKEVLARVADHSVDAPDYKLYFGRDGTLTFYKNFEAWPGTWYSCGVVVVLEYFNAEYNRERLLAIPEEGQISFYDLRGEHRATRALKKGKIF